MAYTGHGGGCCGIAHLFGLDRMSLDDFRRLHDGHFVAGNMNRILEVVLSQRQVSHTPGDTRTHQSIIDAGGWPAVLASMGFKSAEVWRNSNSGNLCYRFIKLAGAGLEAGGVPGWEGETITLRTPPRVIEEERPRTFAVGDTVEIVTHESRYHGRRGVVESVDGSRTAVRVEGLEMPLNFGSTASLIKVVFREETRFPIDPTLPVEIYWPDGRTRSVIPTRYDADRVRTNYGWFHLDTGEYGERTTIEIGGRLRNVPRIIEQLPIPAAAPADVTTVLTEYFATFRDGSFRGPFDSQEAVRETYPRVRRFTTRRVLSDGTTHSEIGNF